MSALRVERDGPVLRIALARPERRNAFDAALIDELTDAFADVGDARVVVLLGRGPVVLGGRRRRVDALVGRADVRRERRRRAAPARDARRDRRLPGAGGRRACRGTRSEAAAASSPAATSRSRSPDAEFAFSEVKLGIVPAVISPFALAKIGPSAARR